MAVLGEVLEQAWQQMLAVLQTETAAQPKLFAVVVLLILGFVGGRIIAEMVRTLLRMTALDDLAVQADIQPILREAGFRGSLSDFVAVLVKWLIYALAALSILYVFGFRVAAAYSATLVNWGTRLVLAAAVMLFGAVIASQLEEVTVHLFRVSRLTGLVDESGAEIPVYVIAGKAVKYLGLLVAFLVALGVAGIDILILNVLLAVIALGIVTALVLGTRDLVRNIAVSVYFQLSRVFVAGDRVSVGEHEGDVAGIRPMYTKLEDGDTTFYVPNWKLATEVIELEEE
ncbi:MAG: mechanosensitive ion channel [Candidatus Nanohaloarchaea archaeon]|nr:mechanosensitive ion channel [Candidatus Nanohaloarchaea archaeon]